MALDESAVVLGFDVMTALWDVEKFYDNINPSLLVGFCKQMDFPLPITILAMMAHLGPRIITLNGSMSSGLVPSSSIIAGCTFSNTFARMHLFDLTTSRRG